MITRNRAAESRMFDTFGIFCTSGAFEIFGTFEIFGIFSTFGAVEIFVTFGIFGTFGTFGIFGTFGTFIIFGTFGTRASPATQSDEKGLAAGSHNGIAFRRHLTPLELPAFFYCQFDSNGIDAAKSAASFSVC